MRITGNRYLDETIFKFGMSESERYLYETGSLSPDLSQISDKENAYLCYLLYQRDLGMKGSSSDVNIRFQFALTLGMTVLEASRAALLSGDIEVFELGKTYLNIEEIETLLSEHAPYESAIASLELSRFIGLLDTVISPDKKAKDLMIKADYKQFFSKAFKYGNREVVRYLADFLGINMLDLPDYEVKFYFGLACLSGSTPLVRYCIDQMRKREFHWFQRQMYSAYEFDCGSFDLELMRYFNAKFGDAVKDPVRARKAYFTACLSGNLELIKYLNTILGEDVIQKVKEYCSEHYPICCSSGNLELIEYLKTFLGEDAVDKIKTNGYYAYIIACTSGKLELIKYFNTILGDAVTETIRANNYHAYMSACSSGNLDLIKYLNNILAVDGIEKVKLYSYNAYINSCSSGNLELVKYLSTMLFDDPIHPIQANSHSAYKNACSSGNLELIEYFSTILGDAVIDAIKADGYDSYLQACSSGNLKLVQYLTVLLGRDSINAIKALNYKAFEYSGFYNKIDISKYFLSNVCCFSYAERHDAEYGEKIVYDWVSYKLRTLTAEKARFESANQVGEFDVEEEDAKYYFYVLRNLIRRGVGRNYGAHNFREAEALSSDIRFLLSIPSVLMLCHQMVTVDEDSPGRSNELLRFAMQIGNEEACRILLQIPFVRELAEANNYYQEEFRGGLELRGIAEDRESSMMSLSPVERALFERIKLYYQPRIDLLGGDDVVFELLKFELVRRYQEKPAEIALLNTEGEPEPLTLPFEWAEFQRLCVQLTEEQQKEALKAYYQHDVHTAYRYLSKPNHWMHPHASYVYISDDRQERWSAFEGYKSMIVLLYLAAFDEEMAPIDGHTIESRQLFFIKQLALIGRAHNWDRQNEAGKEHDDLEADRPSCFSGMKSRLWQSVLGHPFFQVMTEEKLKFALREFTYKHFDSLIKVANVVAIHEAFMRVAFDDYDEKGDGNTTYFKPHDIAYLGRLNFTREDIKRFKDELDAKFLGQIKGNPLFVGRIDDFFELREANQHLHIMLSSGGVAIAQPILTKNLQDIGKKEEKLARWAINKWRASIWQKNNPNLSRGRKRAASEPPETLQPPLKRQKETPPSRKRAASEPLQPPPPKRYREAPAP